MCVYVCVDGGGSFIVRPEWQFILPTRRTEGTSPSDINDAASRGRSSSGFYGGLAAETEKESAVSM